ncbi:MFS transporter [Brevibacterium sandarakinum]|nr:MFS transporter [Brevibacterium sandarakinum]
MTAPGQTAGLSVFTEPLIASMGIDRTALSLSYLTATLIGAAFQPLIGKASDRWNARVVMAVIAVGFAIVLVGLSFAHELFGLTFGYIGVRMAGQGALSLTVVTAVSRAIDHRRGLALGIASAIGSTGISLAPVALERLITAVGPAQTWRWEALAVIVVALPAILFVRSTGRRESTAGSPDASDVISIEGDTETSVDTDGAQVADARPSSDWTLPQARRTGMFWVLAAAVASSSMLSTALAFHQIAVLGGQGLSPAEAAANFIPQTVAALLATLLIGALIDSMNPKIFIIFSMATTSAALLMLPLVAPGWTAISYGLILGAAGGCLRGMEGATFARYYGVTNIGAIRGLATAISLGASALGPYALALGTDLTGSFALPAALLAVIPIGIAIVTVFTSQPRHNDPLMAG